MDRTNPKFRSVNAKIFDAFVNFICGAMGVRDGDGELAARWKEERHNEPLETFNWHALRHFAISCWIEAGLPPKAVQTFAGHSSLQVTMDRYGHLFKSDQHQAVMDGISAQFAPAGPSDKFRAKPLRNPEPS
jgi:integrase